VIWDVGENLARKNQNQDGLAYYFLSVGLNNIANLEICKTFYFNATFKASDNFFNIFFEAS
jgi:hypothetical protein